MKLWRIYGCCSLLLLLSGCASLSKDECITADWQLIGYEDGLKGSSRSRIGDHREACAKHGVTPDMAAYNRGYDEGILGFCNYGLGLRNGQNGSAVLSVCPTQTEYHEGYREGLLSYCTFDSGYQRGLNGTSYRNVCSGEAEQNFLDGYDSGKYIFNLRSSLNALVSDLDKVIEDQEQNEKDIERTKNRITYEETLTPKEKRKLLEELEDFNELSVDLANHHVAIEVEMEEIRRELADLGY